ncbi:NmrA family NAD(P)-binding protein [Celerinatantimonas yamalensis]|uniref:NmrA family NAD(P)-binding protein n=1 Tax=Celerinatantimonas yamalensis TaxID=559956 RepID=A0ABW9G931_9GAMM
MKKYIVTGVDGQLGSRVAENMAQQADAQDLLFTCSRMDRVLRPNMERWQNLGISIIEANYDNELQLLSAFEGGERLWMVSSVLNGPERIKQHKRVLDCAKRAGIQHITYTSFIGADKENYTQYVLPDHTWTEMYLHQLGVSFNVMRNNLYLENYFTNSLLMAHLSDYRWCTTAGEGKATFIAKDDSARVGAALLLGKGEVNQSYDITGVSISERSICELISDYSGIPYQYIPMDNEAFYHYLDSLHIPHATDGDYSKSPVPWCSNDMVTNERAISDGLMDVNSNNVELLTGMRPTNPTQLLPMYKFVWEKQLTNYWVMSSMIH